MIRSNEAQDAVVALIKAATRFAKAHLADASERDRMRLAACTSLTVSIRVAPDFCVTIAGRNGDEIVSTDASVELVHGGPLN